MGPSVPNACSCREQTSQVTEYCTFVTHAWGHHIHTTVPLCMTGTRLSLHMCVCPTIKSTRLSAPCHVRAGTPSLHPCARQVLVPAPSRLQDATWQWSKVLRSADEARMVQDSLGAAETQGEGRHMIPNCLDGRTDGPVQDALACAPNAFSHCFCPHCGGSECFTVVSRLRCSFRWV